MAADDKKVITIGISDLKISPLTKDDDTGVTYGAPIDIPGVKEITLSKIVDEKDLTGDGVTLDSYTKMKGYEVSFTNAQLSTEVLALLTGSIVESTGTNGNKTYTIEDGAGDIPDYFAMEFVPEDTKGAGDYHRTLYKVRGTYEEQFKEDDYTVCSFKGKAVARGFDKKFGKRVINPVAKEITQIPEVKPQTTTP